MINRWKVDKTQTNRRILIIWDFEKSDSGWKCNRDSLAKLWKICKSHLSQRQNQIFNITHLGSTFSMKTFCGWLTFKKSNNLKMDFGKGENIWQVGPIISITISIIIFEYLIIYILKKQQWYSLPPPKKNYLLNMFLNYWKVPTGQIPNRRFFLCLLLFFWF